MAATAWGHLWAGRRIIAHCDNLAVVNIWGRNSSKSPTIMTLVRKLFFIAATHHFTIRFSHIQGVNNAIADTPGICPPLLPFWHEVKQYQLSPPTWLQ